LRNAWRATLLERDCSVDAPWQHWRNQPEDAPITARDFLMQYAESSGMLAAQAVTQHLGLLARAYWLDPGNVDGSEGDRWLHAAPFAPARAVLEGTAMTGWLLDPASEPSERVRRGAVVALWSNPGKYAADVEAAGLEVRRDENNVQFVWSGEHSRPLSISAMIREAHGKDRVSLHARWSKLLHNDPGQTAPRSAYQWERNGVIESGIFCEDEHVKLAGDVALSLSEAGQRQADYFGRSAENLIAHCAEIFNTTKQQLPAITAQMAARAAREQRTQDR
jgi:hypothetical protein